MFGIIVYENLIRQYHIDNLCKKLSSALQVWRKLSSFADWVETSLIAYYSLLALHQRCHKHWTHSHHAEKSSENHIWTRLPGTQQTILYPVQDPHYHLSIHLGNNHPGLVKSNPSLRIESNSYNIVIMFRLSIDLPQHTLKKISNTVLQHTQDHYRYLFNMSPKYLRLQSKEKSFVNKLKVKTCYKTWKL